MGNPSIDKVLHIAGLKMSTGETIRVYLDDLRPTPPGWVRAFWPEDVIRLLEKGNVEVIDLDHDLGEGSAYEKPRTGYDVLTWLEERVSRDKDFPIPKITIHTDNASARQKMQAAVKSIKRFRIQRLKEE